MKPSQITLYNHNSKSVICHLYGELHAAVVHVVVVAHAPLHHLQLLVPVVTDGERLRVTRTLAGINHRSNIGEICISATIKEMIDLRVKNRDLNQTDDWQICC